MTEQEVEIGSISCQALAIIVQGIYLTVWERYSTNSLTVAIIAVLVFINVVPKMEDIIYRVLASRITVGVEESKGKI